MRTLIKYLLPTIVLILAIIFYFRYTESGQKNAYTIMSLYASHKAGLDIDVQNINFNQYPYIRAKLRVEKLYDVDVDGFVKGRSVDLRYTLHSSCYKSEVCHFDDNITIKGSIKGWRNDIHVIGHGKAIDGNVSYAFTKQKKRFKDISLTLQDVNSSKLFSMLDQKAIFKGRANAQLDFKVIEKNNKIGTILYDVNSSNFHDIQAQFHAQINVDNNLHTFSMHVNSKYATLHLKEGTYNQNKKYAHANYTLDVNDLSHLNTLLGGKYLGEFHATGDIEYDKTIHIKGISTDLGGELYFVYDTKTLELFLKKLSFEKLMQTLHTKPFLHAWVNGHGIYDINKKEMTLNTKLEGAKLLPSSLTHSIQKKFNFNIEKEVFDQGSFTLEYKNHRVVSSDFILANNNAFLKLTDTKLNEMHNAISTDIDLHTPKHAIAGKLYAREDTLGKEHFDDIYLTFDGSIEKHYNVKLDGLISNSLINMDYQLNAKRLPSHICTIVDDINLSGHISGSFVRLHVAGSGTAMEGNVSYSGIKHKDDFEDISLDFKNIHALKLFTLLGQPALPSGKADVKAHFETITKTKKKGHLEYHLRNGKYETLPLDIEASADIKDTHIAFSSHAILSTADINITRGVMDLDTNISKAFYTVNTKNLASLEPFIGKFLGSFSATGEISHNKDFQIRGLTSTFGGMIDFLYKKEMLYVDLENVSLKRFMHIFPYPQMLDAKVNGNINYDYKKEKLLVKTNLNNTRFLNSDLVQTVFEKSGVNMLSEVFPNTKLDATYQNKILLGNLMLKNKQSHFYLTGTKLDARANTVNAYFDLHMQGQEFSGKIYGSLKHPKVNLNMQKLIRYQMDKQLDSVMGKGNRKLMESMPMGGVAKDMASEMGGGFLDMFF